MLVLIFIIVLAVTYYFTKWIAKTGIVQPQSKNIKVQETFKIATGKYVQIIQLGDKFYAIGVTKETITFLTPLEKEQLDLEISNISHQKVSFRDILERMYHNKK